MIRARLSSARRRADLVGRWASHAGRAGWVDRAKLAHALVLRPTRVLWSPQFAKLEITTRCNLSCRYCEHACAAGGQPRLGRSMEPAQLERVLGALPRLRWLDIQGVGEPLAHPQLIDLLDVLERRGITLELTTNGLLLDEHLCARLCAGLAYRVTVSLPAASPETFEKLCGAGGFQKVVEAVQRLAAVPGRPQLRLLHVPTAPSIHELSGVVDLAVASGVDCLTISRYQPVRGDDGALLVPRRQLDSALSRAHERSRMKGLTLDIQDVGLSEPSPVHADHRDVCHWPWTAPFIDVDGELRPCCYAPRASSLGNLLVQPFPRLWNGPTYRQLRQQLRSGRLEGLPCATCEERP